jgi:hypothetical protein
LEEFNGYLVLLQRDSIKPLIKSILKNRGIELSDIPDAYVFGDPRMIDVVKARLRVNHEVIVEGYDDLIKEVGADAAARLQEVGGLEDLRRHREPVRYDPGRPIAPWKEHSRTGRSAGPSRAQGKTPPEGPQKGKFVSKDTEEDQKQAYFAAMGWDKRGIPTEATLEYEHSIAEFFGVKHAIAGSQPVNGLNGAPTDISERKKAEQKLRKGQASLAEAQHLALIGSWELDLISNTLTWSDETYRIFELEPQQFGATYEAFLDHVHPDDRETVSRNHLKRLQGEALPGVYPFRIVEKNGNTKWVEINAVLINWEGKPATLNF